MAFLRVLFDCAELSLNSGCVTLLNRLALGEYLSRRQRRSRPSVRRLWKLGNGMIRTGEESEGELANLEADRSASPEPGEPLHSDHHRDRRTLTTTETAAL